MHTYSKTKKIDIAFALFIYAITFLFLFQSYSFKANSALFPKIITSILIFLNTINMYNIIKSKTATTNNKKEIFVLKKFFIIFFTSLFYVFSIKIIGFVSSTFIYLLSSMYLLGVKNKKIILLISIGAVFSIYLCFQTFLNIPIPKSIFWNMWR